VEIISIFQLCPFFTNRCFRDDNLLRSLQISYPLPIEKFGGTKFAFFFLRISTSESIQRGFIKEDMVAYEFYWRDEIGRDHLIGLVPERRRKPDRITPESVSRWVRTFLDDIADFDFNNVSIIRKELTFTSPFLE